MNFRWNLQLKEGPVWWRRTGLQVGRRAYLRAAVSVCLPWMPPDATRSRAGPGNNHCLAAWWLTLFAGHVVFRTQTSEKWWSKKKGWSKKKKGRWPYPGVFITHDDKCMPQWWCWSRDRSRCADVVGLRAWGTHCAGLLSPTGSSVYWVGQNVHSSFSNVTGKKKKKDEWTFWPTQ